MRKKHGSVPKLHTCSGLDSRNEQKTPAFEVPLQTELRFHLRRYEQPHTIGGPAEQQKADGWLTVARSSSSDDDPPFWVAELQQRWPQGGRHCNLALAHADACRIAFHEGYQLPRSCVPPTTRRKDCGCSPSGGSEGGKTRCIRGTRRHGCLSRGSPSF